MWFLKSPEDAHSVDAQTFIYKTWLQDPHKLNILLTLHEKLSYCLQLDNAFALICHYYELPWIKMFTMTKEEYDLLDSITMPSPMEQIVQYHKFDADMVNGESMKYFQPELLVKDFINSTMQRFVKTKDKMILQKKIAKELKDIQENICQTVFSEFDEYAPNGFLDIFKTINGLVVNNNYKQQILKEVEKNKAEEKLLPEIYTLCTRIEQKVEEVKESISSIFFELSQLYDTLPERIKRQDFHWKKLYMFAKFSETYELVEALKNIECSPGKTYIVDNGNTYGWNDTYGVLAGLIKKRISPNISGKRDWEPFILAFDKSTLWDDARKELSNKAINKISEIDILIDNYLKKI
ncbi:hypothetical protein LJC14_07230 [Treponema sp. OttesenSCG-928-L16]|nr:hypothetical protein [Treponema sp. OttesenSCG-928-L16]